MLRNEQEFYQFAKDQPKLLECVFNYEGIINEEELEDIWSIYQIDSGEDVYRTLHDCLFTVSFDASLKQKMYSIEHTVLYDLLAKENGTRHLAMLIQQVATFLEEI